MGVGAYVVGDVTETPVMVILAITQAPVILRTKVSSTTTTRLMTQEVQIIHTKLTSLTYKSIAGVSCIYNSSQVKSSCWRYTCFDATSDLILG